MTEGIKHMCSVRNLGIVVYLTSSWVQLLDRAFKEDVLTATPLKLSSFNDLHCFAVWGKRKFKLSSSPDANNLQIKINKNQSHNYMET